MLTSSDAQTSQLQAQHTLTGQDLIELCAIASQETHINDIYSQIETWKFEQFFGLACHLFITTESAQSRQQLSNLLPKFGSIAVYSLLKITDKFNEATHSQNNIGVLALSSLKQMALQPLVIGLVKTIEDDSTTDKTIDSIIPSLVTLAAHHQDPLFAELAKRLKTSSWNNLQTKLLSLLSDLRKAERFNNTERHIKIKVKRNSFDKVKQLIEVA
ncbi:MAG: hypothetical protein AAFQ63_02795 [Cyanobacteria bacterium J06621_11]